jgi:hypothetical protein
LAARSALHDGSNARTPTLICLPLNARHSLSSTRRADAALSLLALLAAATSPATPPACTASATRCALCALPRRSVDDGQAERCRALAAPLSPIARRLAAERAHTAKQPPPSPARLRTPPSALPLCHRRYECCAHVCTTRAPLLLFVDVFIHTFATRERISIRSPRRASGATPAAWPPALHQSL